MGQRDGFSSKDLTKLNRMYNCKQRQSNNQYQQQNQAYYGNQQRPYYNNQNQYHRLPTAYGGNGGYGFGIFPSYYPPTGPSGANIPSGGSNGGHGGPFAPSGPSFSFNWLAPLANFIRQVL